MSVVRWDPVRELSELQRSINQLFDGRPTLDSMMVPFPVDVYETANEVVVRADLPGVRPDDIQVQHHEGQVYIRATRATQAPENATWLVRQTPQGEMVRSFHLGVPVELEGVHATYEAGVLEVRLPKAEHARPREIPVRVNSASQANSRSRAGEARPSGEAAQA